LTHIFCDSRAAKVNADPKTAKSAAAQDPILLTFETEKLRVYLDGRLPADQGKITRKHGCQ